MLPVLASAQNANGTGAVFVMTNAVDKNEIIAYARDASGNLAGGERFETGGRGSGGSIAPLGSQGSLTLSQDRTLLFAVNAGSGTVSVFRVRNSRLFLIDEISAAGSEPVAVAQQGNLVYVLDAGGQGSVTGYQLQFDGTLRQIENSTAFLTPVDGGSGAGSLSISPNGRFLLVTERVANTVDAFPINADGTLGTEVTTPSLGPPSALGGAFAGQFTPSGFAVVAQFSGSVTSYSLGANGAYTAISANVPTEGDATCWVIVTPNGKYVFTSNTGSANISGFSISATGALTPIGSTVVGAFPAGSFNLDLATSSDGRFLFTIESGAGAVGAFSIGAGGQLTSLRGVEGLPESAGFQGIAAY
jgi:6-phosphogluconolactonase (cycloisomerase 2 family)